MLYNILKEDYNLTDEQIQFVLNYINSIRGDSHLKDVNKELARNELHEIDKEMITDELEKSLEL